MKKILYIFAFLMIFPLAGSAVEYKSADDFIYETPGDFKLTAISGSVSPDYPAYKIELAANGEGVYSVMAPGGRQNGKFKAANRFRLEDIQVLLVYRAVMENNFF